jgi:hypothetical protein
LLLRDRTGLIQGPTLTPKPIRKLYYNLTITAVSVIVAIVTGGLEVLNLIGDQLGLTEGDGFWGAIGAINNSFGILGYIIVGIFVVSWLSLSIASSRAGTYLTALIVLRRFALRPISMRHCNEFLGLTDFTS